MLNVVLLCLLAPLLAFAIQMFVGKRLPRGGDFVSIAAISTAFAASCWVLVQALGASTPDYQWSLVFPWVDLTATWQPAALSAPVDFDIPMGFAIDNLTAVMLLVVTGVSLLVHLFSVGYMHGEDRYHLYFGYLSLFSFSMLWLVLSDNLLGIFVGWELVGVSSYLLIGFFFPKPSAAAACKKAFLTNRVGDLGMWLGIMLIYSQVGTFRLEELFHHVALGHLTGGLLTGCGLLLFVGAVGKSAQLPLHVWLPDAMEGPTPVSALIHAATMVAAGVYLVGRLFPILTPDALLIIAYTGALTAFFAATIAIVQDDIKKVLAYSTVSQLGYMMVGLGVGSYYGGLFHLTTHAFFKACLFLGSGAVIHAVHTQNVWEMGGLRKKLPVTFYTWIISTAAIAGFPFSSGFFSKEAVLGDAMAMGMHSSVHMLIFALPMVAALMTTFYMTRITILTFFGKPRDAHKYEHAHEGGWAMNGPLVVLATMTVFGFAYHGAFEKLVVPPVASDYAAMEYSGPEFGERWRGGDLDAHGALEGAGATGSLGLVSAAVAATPVGDGHGHDVHDGHGHDAEAGHHGGPWGPHHIDADTRHNAHVLVVWFSMAALVFGVFFAYLIYYKKHSYDALKTRLATLWSLLYNKYFVDEVYSRVIVRPLLGLAAFFAAFDRIVIDGIVNGTATLSVALSRAGGWVDSQMVDGVVNGIASTVQSIGAMVRRIETGRIQHYFLLLLGGTLVLMLVQVY